MTPRKTSGAPTNPRAPASSSPITLSPEGTVSIRLSGLTMPDRVFSANWVSYHLHRNSVDLIFGQEIGGRTRLTSALVISVPKRRAVLHFELPIPPSEGRFVASLRRFIDKSGVEVPAIEAVNLDALPDDRIVLESASIFAVAYNDDEAEIGFLKLSPWDLHRFKTKECKEDVAYPVARIFLGTDLLAGLVEALTRELSGDHGKRS